MYNKQFLEIINNLTEKKTLLLHSCCAPCSSYVINYLKDYFDLTIIYYNPNIEPKEEYEKRKKEQIKLCETLKIKFIDSDYDNNTYRKRIKGLENEKEGLKRCEVCFKLRLEKVKEYTDNYDYFTTTLTVSPHKNSKIINEIGLSLSNKYLVSDFKKNEGYKKSIEYSKKYDLYRQDYCGCLFSKRHN